MCKPEVCIMNRFRNMNTSGGKTVILPPYTHCKTSYSPVLTRIAIKLVTVEKFLDRRFWILIFRTVLYIHVTNTEDKLILLRCPTSLRTRFYATCVGYKHPTNSHFALR